MKTVLALALAAAVPSVAAACPVCAQGDRPDAALFIGAMILAPYVVAVLVLRVVRAAGDEP